MTLNWRGNFNVGIQYMPGDVVYYPIDGFTYVCVDSRHTSDPRIYGFELMAGFTIRTIDGGVF